MSITIEQFVERLTQSGLMSAQEIDGFQQQLPPDNRPKDVQQFAQALVQQGKLTKYQAQAVYQGKTKGLVFGEYVVLDKLGEGGMGVVVKAQHRRMKRLVAVKMIARKAIGSPDAVKRFYREVEAAARLMHPNIVAAHDASEQEGIHYLVMEYVEGQDLAAILRDRGPMAVETAVECILQTARGLQYAHEQGIVHRDIKPSNLLLDKKSMIKILDMGLARMAGLAEGSDQDRLTGTGQVMGTCDYMAPEQAMDAHRVDTRADIYSLGCTLYRLLTGNVPYKGETLMQILMLHQQAPIPSLCKVRSDAPPQLDAVFQKMVAKRPEDRQQTMAEVISDLENVIGVASGRAVTAPPIAAESSSGALAKSLAFLHQDKLVGTVAAPQKTTAAEQRTEPYIGPEHDTTSSAVGKPRPAVAKIRRNPLLLVGLAVCLVILLGTILTFTFRGGTLVVEIDEQLGKDVQVTVSHGGEKVQLVDAKLGWKLSLSPGTYDLAVEGGEDQFQLSSESITVTRGGIEKVRVTLKLPPLAVAPFDVAKAKEHQKAWARYLRVPVELTNSIGMKLVLIPPGEVMMGSPKELIEEALERPDIEDMYKERLRIAGPQHRVRISRPFYFGVYEVTQEEYQRVMGKNPSGFSPTGKHKDRVAGQNTMRFPVEDISWDEAVEFCQKLSNLSEEKAAGRWYRLPSEAAWEYACRVGNMGRYGFGSGRSGIPKEYEEYELSEHGWFGSNSNDMTHAVGGKQSNAWGLHDMHGNVGEWCQDWYDKDYYAKSPMDDPTGPTTASNRVGRGGCWGDPVVCCQSAARAPCEPGRRTIYQGFRVCLVLPDTTADRTRMIRATNAAQPSAGSTANSQSPDTSIAQPQSSVPLPAVSSLVGPYGKWNLPPGAPQPAIAPFDEKKAKEHQEAWAKHLGVPVEMSNSIGMKLVLIPPGEFMMGSPKELIEEELKRPDTSDWYRDHERDYTPSEGPQHRVRITTMPLYFGIYEVTNEEYQHVMGTKPGSDSAKDKKTERFPLGPRSWDPTMEFCLRLSELPAEKAAGRQYRLPTEAQWEYACRAGSTGRFSFSSCPKPIPTDDDEKVLSDYGWYHGNSGGQPHAVGEKRPNAWGLYDMHGNMWEWCWDWYDKDYYSKSPVDDPQGPEKGLTCVVRGGNFADLARASRSAARFSYSPIFAFSRFGFRVSMVVAEKVGKPSADVLPDKPPRVVDIEVDANGKWKLPPGAPAPAVAPFDGKKAKEHQEAWAKQLGMPVELSNAIGIKLALIPPGEITTSDKVADDSPSLRRCVRITQPYYLGKYEVTQEQWLAVMGNNPSNFKGAQNPVETVSWDDCQQFLDKLNERFSIQAGRFQFPTSAQWGHACRAGSTAKYGFSDDESQLGEWAWYKDNSSDKTHPVGEKKSNAWGLYDMHGNVFEWCRDWSGYYPNSPENDPIGPPWGRTRLQRGGAFNSAAQGCSVARRLSNVCGGFGAKHLGLRVCLVLAEK